MKKENIVIHGELYDLINYKALIEAQSKMPSFLDNKIKGSNSENKNNVFVKKYTLNRSKKRGE